MKRLYSVNFICLCIFVIYVHLPPNCSSVIHQNHTYMKKRTFILFLFLLLGICGLQAQKIYSTNYKSEADVKVYVTEYRSEADIIVYKTKYSSEATDNKGIWYFTQYKSEAKKKIYFTEYRSEADIKVYFTDYKSEAGWKDKSKQHLFY